MCKENVGNLGMRVASIQPLLRRLKHRVDSDVLDPLGGAPDDSDVWAIGAVHLRARRPVQTNGTNPQGGGQMEGAGIIADD